MLRLELTDCLYLLLIFAGADLEKEHEENLPLLVLIQLHLSKLGILVEGGVRLWNALTAKILFYTLIGRLIRFFGHRLLDDFFEVLFQLFDFYLTQVSFVFSLELLFL